MDVADNVDLGAVLNSAMQIAAMHVRKPVIAVEFVRVDPGFWQNALLGVREENCSANVGL